MKIEALLCDAVSVREGLLHVLGGGITRVHRAAYPAPLGINLALRITLSRDSIPGEHQVRIVLRRTDTAEEIAAATLEFRSQDPIAPPPAEVAFPAAVPLRDLQVPAEGHYLIEIFGDGERLRSFPIEAAAPAPRPHPNA